MRPSFTQYTDYTISYRQWRLTISVPSVLKRRLLPEHEVADRFNSNLLIARMDYKRSRFESINWPLRSIFGWPGHFDCDVELCFQSEKQEKERAFDVSTLAGIQACRQDQLRRDRFSPETDFYLAHPQASINIAGVDWILSNVKGQFNRIHLETVLEEDHWLHVCFSMAYRDQWYSSDPKGYQLILEQVARISNSLTITRVQPSGLATR